MRTRRKRPWAALAVNMTPLIDVVFLIIIFFIVMINFSEMHIRKVNLPKADEARHSLAAKDQRITIAVKSGDLIFLQRKKIDIHNLANALRGSHKQPEQITVQIRADMDVPYEVLKQVMTTLARAGYSKIEFSTLKREPDPLEEDASDEI